MNVTTSTVSLTWTQPVGNSSLYRVYWTEGRSTGALNVTETYVHITNLTAGVKYEISVTAVADDGHTGGQSFTVVRYTKPEIVLCLNVTDITTSSMHVMWSEPMGERSFYRVHWTDGTSTRGVNVTDTKINVTGLAAGLRYSFTVVAVAGDNETESDTAEISHYAKPGIIGQPTVSSTTSSISLTWPAPPGQVFMYRLEWHNGEGPMTRFTNSTSAVLSELTSGINHTITIIAVAGDNKTQGDPYTFTSFTKPNPVLNVAASPRSTTSVAVKWSYPVDAWPYYKYVVETYNITGGLVKTTTVDSNSTDILNLEPGNKYQISVRAAAASGSESTEEQTLSYTKPGIIGKPTVSSNTSSISLTWAAPPGQVFMYRLEWHNGEGPMTRFTNSTSAVLSELTSGTNHTITVVAVAGDNKTQGDPYTFTSFTKPGIIGKPNVSSTTYSISLTWPAPPGQVFMYRLEWYNDGGLLKTMFTNNTFAVLSELTSGTNHTITVIAVAGDNKTQGDPYTFTSFTRPDSVIRLTQAGITTNAVTLVWEQLDSKTGQSYVVLVTQNSSSFSEFRVFNTTFTSTGLASGSNTSFTVTTQTPDGTPAAPVTVSYFTWPYSITGLEVKTLNTTTGRLVWSEPLQYKSEYKYRVQTTGCSSKNQTVSGEAAEISALTPGTSCTFCVFVIAADGTEGEGNCTSQYTKPERVQVSLSCQGSNSSVLVSWSKPPGKVEHFKVHLNSTSSTLEKRLNSTSNSSLFEGLSAGTLYSARVFTCSGPFNASSEYILNATFPNPPGSVEVLRRTTSSIEVRWGEAPLMTAPSFHYKLTHTPSQGGGSKPSNNNHTLDFLLSGTSYNISIATVGPMDFESEKVHIYMVTTRPHSITGLKVETLNTTTGRLVWSKPLQYKSEYKYRVQTTGCSSKNQTVQVQAAEISVLTPGTRCTFCVFVVAADGTEGEGNCTSQYTEPERVQVGLSSQGSNSSVLVSWSKPLGKVEHFKVHLNSTSSTLEKRLNSTSNSFLFEGLSAGTLYSARVFTCSGPFNASSEYILNATFPTPPGSVKVLKRTTSSIKVSWGEAPLMTAPSFYYKLTHTPSQGGESKTFNTSNNNHTFESLLPGTSYNISIATVGVMGFESKKIHINMVTTTELRVQSVVARTTQEDQITVAWDPVEYSGSFTYLFKWTNRHGLQNTTTQKTTYTIDKLDPGSRHIFSVTPEIPNGKPGITTMNSCCTNASPVKNLTCEGPNEPEAKIILSWNKPRGQHSGLRVTANDGHFTISTNTSYNYTVLYPRHDTKYRLTVETLSCGLPSSSVFCESFTGITVPPIPTNLEDLLEVAGVTHNMFSLEINRDLLNNTKGRVTHVGVLVTNNPDGVDTNLKYLRNTYDQWRAGHTPMYLATVKATNLQSRSGGNHLNIEVGDQTKWNGYTNGALDATGQYKYAIVLFTNVTLTPGELVNVEESLASVTDLFTVVILPQNPAVIGVAVGATLGIFFILFIILIGFIIYWKRLSRKEPSDIQIQSMRAKVSMAVRIEDYEKYYKKQRADSNCGFAEEFEDLKAVGTAQSRTSALTVENKSKNRYNNVLPYDFSRVKLSIIHGSPFDDYINANYMPGYNSRKEFIAAQGPLPITISDFWRMVWEKNVLTLVMLTRCNEQGRVKCEQYWGFDTKNCENITVTTTSDIPLDDWTIRDFDIKNVKTAETRSVRQFHFTAWPDHGVPETTELLIDFRHLVREHMDQFSRHSPTVVHCSAGVGRTGTFIAIDRLIFQIERDNCVDVYGIVHDQRMHRTLMVQTEDQYVFLNQCAMDIIRSRTGTNVDLIYQNVAALSEYENIKPQKR